MVVGLVSPGGFSGVGFPGRGWLTLSVLLVRAGRSYGKLKGDPGLVLGSPFFVYVLFLHPAAVGFGEFSFEFVAPESAVFRYV